MANVPLVANPILPPVPDEPKLDFDPMDEQGQEIQKTFDALWKWMKDISLQIKILFGSPDSSNQALSIPLVQSRTILMWAGDKTKVPSGYFICDGTPVSRVQFAALFSAIGTTWGAGDGSTTFNLPDLQCRIPVAVGTKAGLTTRNLTDTGGEEKHQLVTAEMPSHNHSLSDPGHNHGVSDPGHFHSLQNNAVTASLTSGLGGGLPSGPGNGSNGINTNSKGTGIGISPSGTGISIQPAGGDQAHENMPPFVAVNFMVKY